MKTFVILVLCCCGLILPQLGSAALQYGCEIAVIPESAGTRCQILSTDPAADDDDWTHIGVDAATLNWPYGYAEPDFEGHLITTGTVFIYGGGECLQGGYYSAYDVGFFVIPENGSSYSKIAGHDVWGPAQLVGECI